jgi:hypothetical protein
VRLRVVLDDRPAAHRAAPAAARESSAEEPSALPDDKPAAQAGAWLVGEMDPEWMQSSAVRPEALIEDGTQEERSFGSGPTAPIRETEGRCWDEIQEVPLAFAVMRQPVSGASESSLRSTRNLNMTRPEVLQNNVVNYQGHPVTCLHPLPAVCSLTRFAARFRGRIAAVHP